MWALHSFSAGADRMSSRVLPGDRIELVGSSSTGNRIVCIIYSVVCCSTGLCIASSIGDGIAQVVCVGLAIRVSRIRMPSGVRCLCTHLHGRQIRDAVG